MHKFEKIWMSIGTGSLILFLVILGVSAVHAGHTPAASGIETIHPDYVRDDNRFSEPGLYESSEEGYDYDLYYVASAFRYEPAEVEVPQGSRVRMQVVTTDVVHGFQVVNTNINMMVEPGLVSTYGTNFNTVGEYLVICNEYCGVGHTDMTSVIKVVPEEGDAEDE
ncbi:Cytochrome c oxidase subunit 2 [Lacicoccus alkaliphilus]|uniref:Cytochrome aa3 subunit 2 n=1 Tax=Lacicoccus alkaliphilus DSM 16010 TaxID=1123231 RepID=A0A1M7BRE3_9BACL|nr:cytochrome c oxidase subunit 2 [Salinicoccus alkaliphilus DSM 16010]